MALDTPDAVASMVAGKSTDARTRTEGLTAWVHHNIRWSRTNYRQRSAEQVMRDGAGNCWDQSRVLSALLDAAGLRWREIAEINVQPLDVLRGAFAAWMVHKSGNRASVFGWRHNDHRWLEVALEDGTWIPADPSLGLCGPRPWVMGRLGFRDRPTGAVPPARVMIAPFAIVVPDAGDGGEDRTGEYVVSAFDAAYDGRLRTLNAWGDWQAAIRTASPLGSAALLGEGNLHRHASVVASVAKAYRRLGREALRAGVA